MATSTTSTTTVRPGSPPTPWQRPLGSTLRALAFTVGILSIGLGAAAKFIPFTVSDRVRTQLPWVEPTRDWLARWALPAGIWMTAGILGITLLRVVWRAARRRSRLRNDKVMAACVAALHLPQAQLSLAGAKWARKGGGLTHGQLRYRPPTAVLIDQSKAIGEALRPFTSGRTTVTWVKQHHRFDIHQRQIRVEETHAELGRVVNALSHLLGAVTVDQKLSTVDADGSVQRVVASYNLTTKDVGDGFRQRVQAVLDSKAPSPTGYWQLNWDPAANKVTVEPSQPLPTRAAYPLEAPGEDEQDLIPIGVGEGGRVVHWRPKMFPHLMVVGRTGSGKTIFLSSVMISCLMRGWIVLLLDPKELSFRGFDPRSLVGLGLPTWGGIQEVATSEADMEAALSVFHDLMRNRYSSIKGFQVSEDDLPPVLMIVDETGELVERLAAYHTSEEKLADLQEHAERQGRDPGAVAKPKGTKNPELAKIWSGLRLGRQSKNQIALGLQRPDVAFIPGEARANATTRVALGRLDGAGLEMMFNSRAIRQRTFEVVTDPRTGQRMRQQIKGRATVDVGAGPQTIQTFWVPDPADAIIGKLSDADRAVVMALHELVEQSRQRWSWQTEAPTATGRGHRAGTALFDRELSNSLTVDAAGSEDLQHDSDHDDDSDDGGDLVKVSELVEGQQVVLEVDGHPTTVEIETVEEDPFDPEELQLTYRIVDGPSTGQPGVTTYAPGELIYRHFG